MLYRVKNLYQEWDYKQFIPILLCSFLVLYILCKIIGEGYEPGANSYKSPLLFIICSIIGWVFLYSASNIINHYKNIKKLLMLIGKDTVSIVILHFLCFKIISLYISYIYDLPSYCVAVFPNLYGSVCFWWLAYTFVGVCLPVILFEGYKGMSNYIQKNYY